MNTSTTEMRLIVDWGEKSERIDALLERGCQCGGGIGRLVKHWAGNGFQVWISCCACSSKLRSPLPHASLKRWQEYPIWSEVLDEVATPEEVLERTPVSLWEIYEETKRSPALAGAHRDFEEHGILVVAEPLAESDLAEIAPLAGVGSYATLNVEGQARLLKFEADYIIRILTPHRRGKKLDLSDRRTVQLIWKEKN